MNLSMIILLDFKINKFNKKMKSLIIKNNLKTYLELDYKQNLNKLDNLILINKIIKLYVIY